VPRLWHWEILFWAEAHHDRTGQWPTKGSGAIPGAAGETWLAVNWALKRGSRGLPGGESLAQLLDRRCRTPNVRPALTTEQILTWADAHHRRRGDWPTLNSGAIPGAPGEIWQAVDGALRKGHRGQPGGSSLARVLGSERGARNHKALLPYTVERILGWADVHHARTGKWPTKKSGPIGGAPGETWAAVEGALSGALRGLPGGETLAQLLARRRGKRNHKALPALSAEQIRVWVRGHYRRTGCWPRRTDGPIPNSRGETWGAVAQALGRGLRGLPGGSSLARVVHECQAGSAKACRRPVRR
jgi:hypothetical protein